MRAKVQRGAVLQGVVFVLILLAVSSSVFASADLDGDGDFDQDDVTAFFDAWRAMHSGHAWNRDADLNGDAKLNRQDAEIMVEAMIAGRIPSVRLPDYLVFLPGGDPTGRGRSSGWYDTSENDTVIDRLELVQYDPGRGLVYQRITDVFWRSQIVLRWATTSDGSIVLKAIQTPEGLYKLNPPDGVVLPDNLDYGRTWVTRPQTYDANGQNLGLGSLTLRLSDRDLRVSAGGRFVDECAKVDFRFSLGGFVLALGWYLGPGVGIVAWENHSALGTVTYRAKYINCTGFNVGTRERMTHFARFPLFNGDIHVWEHSSPYRVWGTRWSTSQGVPMGEAVESVMCIDHSLLPNAYTWRDWWLWEGANSTVRGIMGWTDGADEIILRSSDGSTGWQWPDESAIVGQVLEASGTVAWNGTLNWGGWHAWLTPLGVGPSSPPVHAQGPVFALRITIWRGSSSNDLVAERCLLVHSTLETGWNEVKETYAKWSFPPVPLLDRSRIMLYKTVGQTVLGRRPTMDPASMLCIRPTSRWRYRYFGTWKFEGVYSTGDPDTVATLSLDSPNGKGVQVTWDYWSARQPLEYVGLRMDPIIYGDDAKFTFSPPLHVPNNIAIGELETLHCALRDESGATAGSLYMELMFVGRADAGISGTDLGDQAYLVQIRRHYLLNSGDRFTRYSTLWLVPQYGKVREIEQVNTGTGPWQRDYSLNYCTVAGGGSFSAPSESIRPPDYMLREAPSQWIFGRPSVGYTDFRSINTLHDPQFGHVVYFERRLYQGNLLETYYYRAPLTYLYIKGYKPEWLGVAGPFTPELPLPDPWTWGTGFTISGNLTFNIGGTDRVVPYQVQYILTGQNEYAHTPAAEFSDTIDVVWLMRYDFSGLNMPTEWIVNFGRYARGIGPVELYERRTNDDSPTTPGPLVYANILGREIGRRP